MTSNAAIPKVCKSKIWLWSARVKSDYVDTHGLHFSYQSYNSNIHKATQDKQKFIYAQSPCPSVCTHSEQKPLHSYLEEV